MSRQQTIITAAIMGAIIGSGLGIAGFGDAINGAYVLAPLAAFIAYLYTRPAAEGTPEPIEEIQQTILPTIVRWLAIGWNSLMRALIVIRIMPFFVKRPWLLAVLIILLMALMPFISLLFVAIALTAAHKEVKAEHNFLIHLE